MVMVIGGGQGGRGEAGCQVDGGHFWTESGKRGVPGMYLVQGREWGAFRQSETLLAPLGTLEV